MSRYFALRCKCLATVLLGGIAAQSHADFATRVVDSSPAWEIGTASNLLGAPDGTNTQFDNVGAAPGYVIVSFGDAVFADAPGNDLFVHLTDWSESYETFSVYVSSDGVNFTLVGQSGPVGGPPVVALGFDVGAAGVTSFRYAKIVNGAVSSSVPYEGADIDAIEARSSVAQTIQWTRRVVGEPSQRSHHKMVQDTDRGVTVLFGGNLNSGVSGETWEWNGNAWTQRVVSGPSPRSYHAMAYDTARRTTVLFGGSNNVVNLGQTWEWEGNTWVDRGVNGPSPRSGHAMAYDSVRGVIVLFGGETNAGSSGETWEWNGTAWSQRMVSGPSVRHSHAMAYDRSRQVTILFGGDDGSGSVNGETWQWNGIAWSRWLVSGPSSRRSHEMAFDAARDVVVLFGRSGVGNTVGGETWEWNGTGWIQRLGSGPSPRFHHALAYDPARRETVLFGGYNGNEIGETWVLGCSPFITAHPSPQSGCLSGSVAFTVSATNGSNIYQWQWQPAGSLSWIPIVNGLNTLVSVPQFEVTGATTFRVSIRPALAQGGTRQWTSSSFRVRSLVSNSCNTVISSAATFTLCAADFNCDSSVDFFDYLDFVDAFSSQLPGADFNGDSVIDFFDYLDFVDAFSMGC